MIITRKLAAIEVAKIEAILYPENLIHAALGGSCLYKGSSEKDIDVIIYPHDASLPTTKVVKECLRRAGVEFIEDSKQECQSQTSWNQNGSGKYVEVLIGRREIAPTIYVRLDFILCERVLERYEADEDQPF
mgnify:CR=1 FL=1